MLELRGVRKAYSGVEVLHGVDLQADSGEVLAIAGANGAGKSTLIRILSGAVARDEGEILLDGRPVELATPRDAQALGVRTVHQELSLVPQLSVTENVLLGDMPRRRGLVDWTAAHECAAGLLTRVGLGAIDPTQAAGRLSLPRRQMVEIAKAIAHEPRILILDEPSAVLAGEDLEQLFRLIGALREQGALVLYVSHRLEEVIRLADRVTVMKDGRIVATEAASKITEDEIVRLMAGRRLEQIFPDRRVARGRELLGASALSRDGAFEDVSFGVHEGEVVGMFGLVGSGRSEVAECLFGAAQPNGGEIRLGGRPETLRSPRDAIAKGVALLTEDRKRTGLVLGMSVQDNAGLPTMYATRRWGLINRRRQAADVRGVVDRLDVQPRRLNMPVGHLSGGNQQKVVLSKWLLSKPKVLILDEPTRGVDVATRVDLYGMIDELTRAGLGVLMISSDLTEVLGASDRLLVMREGRLVAELDSAATGDEEVLAYCVGVAA